MSKAKISPEMRKAVQKEVASENGKLSWRKRKADPKKRKFVMETLPRLGVLARQRKKAAA